MNYFLHSHCDGEKVVPDMLIKEITFAISAITIDSTKKIASQIRCSFLNELKCHGWSSEVSVSNGSDITITSLKKYVGLCLQTGNMARIYADLIKLQTLYLNDSINCAVIVLPSHTVAKTLGSNIANSKRLERELNIFKKAYHVPTLIFALDE
ncbi:hypothetical protein KTN00_14930 [Acinetobacter soli]|uniref:BglII/BstYI family type II restriction endonuclease n=1 Tax=Acinetobacter soli TaxID=487316 RepID=UPI001C4484B1|nr:BglII/BstYI family type II restriction endonuclease [Acinetobacter soli]MBV6552298.1 hypothetical protein [Acinetobacter soli]